MSPAGVGGSSRKQVSVQELATDLANTKLSAYMSPRSPRSFTTYKVPAADVASIGHASDTFVCHQVSRDLHEAAKRAWNEGRYQEAMAKFEAILSAQVKRFGPCHSSVAAAMHNVAVCCLRLGQNQMAENLLQEALQIRYETLGPRHLEVAMTLCKLGETQTQLGDFAAGLDNLSQARLLAEELVGAHHKLVGQVVVHVACLYDRAGDLKAATRHLNEACFIYRQSPDAAFPLSEALCHLGSIESRSKNFESAVVHFSEALTLQSQSLPPGHSRIVATLDNLAYAQVKRRNYEDATLCYEEMWNWQTHHHSWSDVLETLKKQVYVYQKLQQSKEALRVARRTWKLAKPDLPKESEVRRELNQLVKKLQEQPNDSA